MCGTAAALIASILETRAILWGYSRSSSTHCRSAHVLASERPLTTIEVAEVAALRVEPR
jgi:hypothetical protein